MLYRDLGVLCARCPAPPPPRPAPSPHRKLGRYLCRCAGRPFCAPRRCKTKKAGLRCTSAHGRITRTFWTCSCGLDSARSIQPLTMATRRCTGCVFAGVPYPRRRIAVSLLAFSFCPFFVSVSLSLPLIWFAVVPFLCGRLVFSLRVIPYVARTGGTEGPSIDRRNAASAR